MAGSNANHYTVTAVYSDNCTAPITTCVWSGIDSAVGSMGTDSKLSISPDAPSRPLTFTCTFDGRDASFDVAVLSQLNATCWGDDLAEGGQDTAADAGYWDGEACWIMAAEANSVQTCSYACDVQLGATCVDESPSNWDDDNKNICLALANLPDPPLNDLPITPTAAQLTDSSFDFAPFLTYLQNSKTECRARLSGVEPSNLCTLAPSTAFQHRICKCQ